MTTTKTTKWTPVIVSILDLEIKGEAFKRVKFLAIDGYATILKSFTTNEIDRVQDYIKSYCEVYGFQIV